MILAVTDFEGNSTAIDQSIYSKLPTYLSATKEEKYIKKTFGSTLGAEFIADLTGTPSRPQTAKWTDIFDEFVFDNGGYSYSCSGIYEILKFLFYNDFVSEQKILNQAGGNSSVRVEASDLEGLIGKTTIIHNRAVENICVLQAYIQLNSSTYSDFMGQSFELQSGL